MAKNPALTVVAPGSDLLLSPPAGLGGAGLALWKSVQAQYQVQDAGGLNLLEQACRSVDRAHDCAEQITRDGALIATKQGPKDHPLLRHETANRALAVRILVKLGLDVEPLRPIGRPAHGFGWRPD